MLVDTSVQLSGKVLSRQHPLETFRRFQIVYSSKQKTPFVHYSDSMVIQMPWSGITHLRISQLRAVRSSSAKAGSKAL